jgi:Kef-type K+ transport system membrane component KefB
MSLAPVGIELQMSVLLFVAMAGYLISSRLGWSVVIGEILVGILVGPSFLGLVTYTDFVRELATMGSIFLLFVIGLETRFREVYTFKSGVIALVGVIIPWIGGFLLAYDLGYSFMTAFVIGVALTATSIAITVHVLREMGKLNTPAANAIIGAAVIDDVLGLFALSITARMSAGAFSAIALLPTIAGAVIFLLAGAYIGMKGVAPLMWRLNKWSEKHGVGQVTFITAVAIAFAYSVVAELIGLSAIVGAFLAGMSLENLRIKSYREGSAYLEIIFAAIFFISLGVLVNLRAVPNLAGVSFFVVALTGVAVLTKLLGCYLPAKLLGFSGQDSAIIGFGMVPRGEIAMIVALTGFTSGLIDQSVYSALLLMSLLTTIATPLAIKKLYKT